MKNFYTLNSELEDCSFIEAKRPEIALTILLGNRLDVKFIGVERLSGDCWHKWYGDEPTAEDLQNLIDTYDVADQATVDDLIVSKPGTHPGGNCYWIDINGGIEQIIYEEIE